MTAKTRKTPAKPLTNQEQYNALKASIKGASYPYTAAACLSAAWSFYKEPQDNPYGDVGFRTFRPFRQPRNNP